MSKKLTLDEIKTAQLLPVNTFVSSHLGRPNSLYVMAHDHEKPIYVLVSTSLVPFIDGDGRHVVTFSAEINTESNYGPDELLQVLKTLTRDGNSLNLSWLQEECGNADTMLAVVKCLGETDQQSTADGGNNFRSRFLITLGVTPEVYNQLVESYQRMLVAILSNRMRAQELEKSLVDPAAALMQSALNAAKNPPTTRKETDNGPL